MLATGLLMGLFQLALLALIGLFTSSYLQGIVLEFSAASVFLLTLLVGFFSSGVDKSLKTLAIAQLIVWPILILNTVPTLESAQSFFNENFFLHISGFVLLVVSFFGSTLGSLIRIFYDEFMAPEEVPSSWVTSFR